MQAHGLRLALAAEPYHRDLLAFQDPKVRV
jgi:hypothetical protein